MYLMLSLIGILSVERLISRIQKCFFINTYFLHLSFWILTFPIYIFLYFKDHFSLFIVYIGLILISLIFFLTFYEKKLKKVFLMSQLNVVNALILQIQSGKSSQKVLLDVFQSLSKAEKRIYQPLEFIMKTQYNNLYNEFRWSNSFFNELKEILKSETRLIQQLIMFREGLKVHRKFFLRKEQVSRQIKAQAIVSLFIYILIFLLSYYQLDLKSCYKTILISLLMLLLSLVLIFKLGGRIKWSL